MTEMSKDRQKSMGWLRPTGQILGILLCVLYVLHDFGSVVYNGVNANANLRAELAQHGIRAPGKILEMRGGKNCPARFRYETREGQTLTQCYSEILFAPELKKLTPGMAVDVIYNHLEPSHALPAPYTTVPQIDGKTKLNRTLFPILLAALVMALAAGILAFGLWASQREKRAIKCE
ncbi:DUF3592 domain-containing protein [Novosphingobium sp.]|uniref:DUF3592 domain-containing protein n=1 Tax=Novosphingobium sp. TaxID=1874826 RepID=UPI0025D90916|nr:DUF3592 domain-containing protein [Novosphingobium sp.]